MMTCLNISTLYPTYCFQQRRNKNTFLAMEILNIFAGYISSHRILDPAVGRAQQRLKISHKSSRNSVERKLLSWKKVLARLEVTPITRMRVTCVIH